MEERPADPTRFGDLARLTATPPPPGERRRRALRVLAYVALLVVMAGVGWYLVTRDVESGPGVKPSPAAPAAPAARTASPAPAPTPAVAYRITGVDSCLRMRHRPSTRAPVVDCLQVGVRLRGDGRTATREGHVWAHVYDHLKKRWAWAASEYLERL